MALMSNLDELTDDERLQFTRLILDSLRIDTYSGFSGWMQGGLQRHLPHDILIASWGYFSFGPIRFDIIPARPETGCLDAGNYHMERFLKHLFTHWDRHGRAPVLLGSKGCRIPGETSGDVEFHQSFGNIKSILVHAIKGCRGRHDCLYAMLSTEHAPPSQAGTMLEALLPYMDASLRKLAHFPEPLPKPVPAMKAGSVAHISPREEEVMELVQLGKTNVEIGKILDISAFTVKNHLQHIFRKLDVINRAQAVARLGSRFHSHETQPRPGFPPRCAEAAVTHSPAGSAPAISMRHGTSH